MDKQRENGALLIAASIVAAIRLRGESITRSPKVLCAVSDSVQLARMYLRMDDARSTTAADLTAVAAN